MNRYRIRKSRRFRFENGRMFQIERLGRESQTPSARASAMKRDETQRRCLCCMEKMEEKADIAWILGLRRFLCEECAQKIFIRSDDLFMLSRKRQSRAESVLRTILPDRKSFGQTENVSERTDRSFVQKIRKSCAEKRTGRYVRFRHRQIPILQIYERTDDLSALWRQFSALCDYELKDVFLEEAQEWTDGLQEFSLFSICPFDQKWVSIGWNPIKEAFSASCLPVIPLLKKNADEEIELTEQAGLCISRLVKTGFPKALRRAVLIAEPEITDEELGLRLQFLESSLSDLKVQAVVMLFAEES